MSSPVKELGFLKRVSTHFYLKPFLNSISVTFASFALSPSRDKLSAKNEMSGLETLIKEIAPTPGGEEHATIVSSKAINSIYFLGPCIYICTADTREFMNQ